MAIRLGILGVSNNWYVSDLMRACREEAIEASLLSFPNLLSALMPADRLGDYVATRLLLDCPSDSPAPKVPLTGSVLSAESDSSEVKNSSAPIWPPGIDSVDTILVRSMPIGSLEQVVFRMDCLRGWQSQGTAVVNSPYCLEACIDKWLTLHRLYLAGLPVPPTVVCQNRSQALEAFESLGRDVLVKPLFGGEGRGIIRLQDREMAWRAFSTLQQLGQVMYVQQFVPNPGYDIRVLVLGDQLFSIRRRSLQGEYRSNVSQGGIAESHQLTEQQRLLAIRSARAVGGTIVGVDLLPTLDGGLLVLEVNAVPGWKALSRVLQLDISRQLVRMLASPGQTYAADRNPLPVFNPLKMS
jgi:RimK family alpha-L-glutamate ligase